MLTIVKIRVELLGFNYSILFHSLYYSITIIQIFIVILIFNYIISIILTNW